MLVVNLVGLLGLIVALVDTVKHLFNLDLPASRNSVITQVSVFLVGAAVFLLAGNADISSAIPVVEGHTLGSLDGPSLILISLLYSSTGSLVVKALKSFDNTDSNATPALTRYTQP